MPLTFMMTLDPTPQSPMPHDEQYARALRRLGHTVVDAQEAVPDGVDCVLLTQVGNPDLLREWRVQMDARGGLMAHVVYDLIQRKDAPLLEQHFCEYREWHTTVWPLMDMVFVKEPDLIPEMEKLGVKAVYMDQGAVLDYMPRAWLNECEWRHDEAFDVTPVPEWKCDVALVGNPYPSRLGLVDALARVCDVKVFGFPEHEKRWNQVGWPMTGTATGRDMARLAASAKIIVGDNFRNDVRGFHSQRTWQVLGAKGCFLCHEWPGARDLFTPQEVCFFTTPEEAAFNAQRLLEHDSVREDMREAGFLRATRNLTEHRMRDVLVPALEAAPKVEEASGGPRVAMFVENTKHYSGGRIYQFQAIWCLAKMGYEVWCVTNREPLWMRDYEHANIRFVRPGSPLPTDFKVIFSDNRSMASVTAREHKTKCPDATLVKFNFETPNWVESLGLTKLGDRMRRGFEDRGKDADAYICCSEEGAKHLCEWLGREAPVTVLPPAVNSHHWGVQIDRPADRPYAVWCARPEDYKLGSLACDAIWSLDIPFDLVVIGTRGDGLRPETPLHKAHVFAMCDDATKYGLLREARVLLAPSLFEGFGLTPGEAMSVGTQSVVFELPVLRWAYGDRLIYVPWNRPDEYVRTVRQVCSAPKPDISEHQQWVREAYSLDAMGQRLEQATWLRGAAPELWAVISTHNRAGELRNAWDHLVCQHTLPDAVVVVNDGSVDRTKQTLEKLAAESPFPVHLVHLAANHGVNAARRVGNALVPESAAVLEVDDHDPLNWLAVRRVKHALVNPATQYVYGDARHVYPSGRVEDKIKKDYRPWLYRDTQCWSSGVRAYRKSLYTKVGGWGATFPAGDYELALRMERACGGRGFVRIPHVLCDIQFGGPGITRDHKAEQTANAEALRVKAQEGTL